ncbi:ankyrin repeat domain-containing protein SOWAHB-like isoform X1 [Hippocampus zosterae]|uniref:ankyrin repeat domain-containing protein SOWAHB-like isoform X1 n=1 Tax=Hippocampus zosterae TaxID=109293 RepID=UPI00223E21D6|nr:ankyrin repeat domain-containing protein SOWAHB-like isoform X1 [Hippocampus zosterae]
MDTGFSQDSVLRFLQSRGGSVKNADLLLHFKGFLRDHADQVRNRELFKKFVNSVATVKQEHGVSHVVLRKKFRASGPSGVGTAASGTRDRSPAEPPPPPLNPAWSKEKVRHKPRPGEEAASADVNKVLPAAGIVLNNNNNTVESNLNLTLEPKQVPRAEAAAAVVSRAQISAETHPRPQGAAVGQSHPRASVPHGQITQRVSPPGPPETKNGGIPHDGLKAPPRHTRNRQSYKTAVSHDDDDDDEGLKMNLSTSGVGPLRGPLTPLAESSTSHSIASSPTERIVPLISIQNVAEGEPRLRGPKPSTAVVPVSMPDRRSLPADCSLLSPNPAEDEGRRYSQPAGVVPEPGRDWRPIERTTLSSSHGSVFSYAPDAGTTGKLPFFTGAPVEAFKTQQVLRRPPGTKRHDELKVGGAPWHHSTGDLLDKRAFDGHVAPFHRSTEHLEQRCAPTGVPWHHSSGDLHDTRQSSDSWAASRRRGPSLARRVGGRLSGRMCRSMGADLNQLLREDEEPEDGAGGNEAARRRRLHRISSSLSLRYNLSSSSLSSCSSPSRCDSLADLAEGAKAKGKTAAHHQSHSRQSLVPLEPREHAWLVKGASGAWPDVYSLFREDCTLLNRRDFISGFTVLHWIAKHGDHRVLNTLWYGVQKAGLAFDINARSSCGQTPLHVAAIHANKNMIRLLVNKFDADVKLRDTAGKKPWQYLSPSAPQDVLRLLGAPTRHVADGGGEAGSPAGEGGDHRNPHQRRRQRRHRLSFAPQDQRPRTVSGTKVKRSSSIAAFLKHKSLARFHGDKSDS